MRPFTIDRPSQADEAVAALAGDPGGAFIAGGTELVNWLKEGIVRPSRLLDINHLPRMGEIEAGPDGLRIGALTRMADVADHPAVRRDYPAISQSLLQSASQQLRNMASMGGNLLQRTRCPYFRAETELPCNKRRPGTGCAALNGEDRTLAVFGWSEHCLATHPSDVAVALAALDATVWARSAGGERSIPLVDFHRLPGGEPERDTVLERGELITAITVRASAVARRSCYVKIRERASYEFALVSVAAGVDLDPDGRIREARLALGGVAPKPWRLAAAEAALVGVVLAHREGLRSAIRGAFADARPRRHNDFKVELAQRAAVRALQTAGGMP
ncbi:MAG: xanthine dehydrogenase family protein subunit M [Candidatus Dormibacteraeota bacterium]|nr:xanthine dehydrogenase family protein subunit M [Candidatus Dormibacteraeota bacterium]